MGDNTPPDDATLLVALQALRDASGNKAAAARSIGMAISTFKGHIDYANERGLTLAAPTIKPRIRVPARSVYQPMPNEFGKAVRVLVWGDAHDAPTIPDKSRFRHLGMLASELQPDFIVDVGDSLDLDSLSMHALPGSMEDRARPGFLTEIASLTDAYGEFNEAAPSADEIPRYHLDGNHCYRANRFENANPAAEGVYTIPLQQVFARYGFTNSQYREWLFLEGVGFTHAPTTGMGREVGGVNANQTVSRETTFSVVWGHTHKREVINRPKFGIGNQITVFNTGSMMPQGYIKQYAGLAMTGWTYGPSELTLRDGQIESVRSWSVLELAERYG
jgi:hypothetical protein